MAQTMYAHMNKWIKKNKGGNQKDPEILWKRKHNLTELMGPSSKWEYLKEINLWTYDQPKLNQEGNPPK
jgi:hypothetical protein